MKWGSMSTSRDDENALETDVDFATQRQYYHRFDEEHSFFVDWLVAIYWELQGKTSPFEYATRICVAERILKTVNLSHVLASQKVLLRIVRNLFPYDKLGNKLPPKLCSILGESRGRIKLPKFRPLIDTAIKSDEMVLMRYRLLAEAFCGEAKNQITIIRESIDEEEIPSYMNLAKSLLQSCAEDVNELKRLREIFYLQYPPELIVSVANSTLKMQTDLKRRSELPKDMEPEYLFKVIGKHETMIRGKLQSIIMDASQVSDKINARKQVYFSEINELLTMSVTVQDYVSDGPFDEIQREAESLIRYLNDKFSLDKYMPADILQDLKLGNDLYLNGFLTPAIIGEG